MSLLRSAVRVSVALFAVGSLIVACSDDDPPPPPPAENAGSACAVPADCYKNLDGGMVQGTVECITKVPNGYCTHSCTADTDCCAVPGECKTNIKQVCSPLENQPGTKCFLSCEDAVVKAYNDPAALDPNVYCQKYAHPSFGCRSTGGGAANRKVCLP